MFLAECISTGNSFQLYFSFHTKTRGEGGGNNNKLLPKFPPTLSITLYFYCKLDAPPPLSPSIEEICVFCHRTIWQKKQKAINDVLYPNFYGKHRVAELSPDLPRNNARILRGCKTEKYRLVAENRIGGGRKLSTCCQPQRGRQGASDTTRLSETRINWKITSGRM